MKAPARTVPAPGALVVVADRVEARLRALLDAELDRWSAVDADLADPLGALAGLVLGSGKRLRAAFCWWGHAATGAPVSPGSDTERAVIDACAAFELLQGLALVHDDVMDGSATRRGARTTHLAFEARHRAQGWRGDPRRFGEGVAILVGDLAHVYADLLVAGAPDDALVLWNELRLELNVGQYLDLLGTARRDTDLARATRIAHYKSGKYTIERPLHVGAALAGGLDRLRAPLSAYGLPLGQAFQLRDDVLGAFGDEAVTGKPVGDDLREGKPTPLLAVATERATAAELAVLARAGDRQLSADAVADVQAVLLSTGALDEIEASIEALAGEAIAAVEASPIAPEARAALADLARYVAWRDR